ncbi:protein ALTERED PHOSPHATE STARVATION RESPONSE 1 [Cryptomeria japonica]|uniref:protein ALTERED PHOSPHATE STARVATION RESPONSE 1 n=1 Tax=Cryptomeria japonica TaxID=3369 RepID=UPI0025AB9F80|nr:protein ALTERED PHOSPHATE STARVATION RESPONSE 1 [Cryptomeria japonica]XP_057837251.1 protein ALTERED PHOSPHATE STARVATION RESPONSE 1 [Cryptomeria japonica]
MGCSTSKLDNEDAVLSCKERRLLIKQAVEHRYAFAEAHVAYVRALKNVGSALRLLIEGDEMSLCSSIPTTPTFTSTTTETSSGSLPEKSSPPQAESPAGTVSSSTTVVNHLRSGGAPPLFFEERPPSPQRVSLESYPYSYSTVNQYGIDSFFSTHLPPPQSSVASLYNNNNPDYLPTPPSPPRTSTWDFFNPFLSLDNPYPYHDQRRLSQVYEEDEIRIMKQVREEEGIPELEEENRGGSKKEEEKKETEAPADPAKEQPSINEPAAESNADALTQVPSQPAVETVVDTKDKSTVEEIPSKGAEGTGDVGEQVKEKPGEEEVKDKQVNSENVDVPNIATHRPMSMLQVMKEIEDQFIRAYQFGNNISALLEASKVHHSSSLSDIKENSAKVLSSSFSLLRSLSSRSSSSRSYVVSSSSKEDTEDSSSEFVEDCVMIAGSHASTLERIFAWEKKLYDEVKDGERLRITYDKKCMQLRNQESKGEDFQVVEKTRVTIKSLHARIKVSIHAVDSISRRIQKLSTEELQPQLVELIQGLMQMWKGMLECHQIQYQIITEAKSLSCSADDVILTDSHQQATSHLENTLHDWHRSFSKWIYSQKAYVQALYGWLSKCIILDSNSSSKSKSPSSSHTTGPLIFIICREWYHAINRMPGELVIEKIKKFSANVHALWEQRDEEHRQKRRTEYLSKDLERKVAHLQRVESRRHDGAGPIDTGMSEQNVSIESFRKRVEEEKERHKKIIHETQDATLKTLQTGLALTLEALTQFASASVQEYEQLHQNSQNSTISDV